MKRILLSVLALGGFLFATSCQKESMTVTQSGEVEFSITAGIPGEITTYAPGFEAFSHQGGASNLSKDDYILRYTLQVFDNDGKLAYEGVQYAEDFGGVTFDIRLLAKEYDFVFWADFVSKNTKESDLYYNTEDLRKISYTSAVTAGVLPSDALDAYYRKEDVNLKQSGQSISNVVLKRPVGKIRFVAIDDLSDQQKGEVDGATVTVKYQDGTVLPNVFNAQTGNSSVDGEAPQRVSGYTTSPIAEKALVNSQTYEDAYLLGFDYIFCSDNIPSYTMDVTVGGMAGVEEVTRSLSSIPVYENKLTTVVGNFYTNEGKIDVIVDDGFDDDEAIENVPEIITVATSAGIQDAIDAAQDGDIIVIGPGTYGSFDVTKSETRSFFQLPADKSLTFRGANAGVAGTGSRGEETVITIPFTYAHSTTTTADFTFDGLKFTGDGRVSVGKASCGNLTFINNVVTDITINSDPGTTFFTTSYVYDNNSYTMGDIVVENNLVDGTTLSTGANSCGFRMWGISSATFKDNTFKNFNHSAAQFDHVSGDLNFDGNAFEGCNNYKFRVQVINIEGERNYGTNEGDVTEKGFVLNNTTGAAYDSIREAVIAANDNEEIIIASGQYDLGEPAQVDAAGPNGYYLRVDKSLSFVGEGAVVITTSEEAENNIGGVGSLQNLVTVDAENVSFKNITFKANYNNYYGGPNKIIEVRNTGFSISDCSFIPNEKAPEDCGSAVYFSQNADNGVVENCVINYATVSFDGLMEGNFTVKGNKFVKGNGNFAITTPNWTTNDVTTSTLYVNLEGNTFEGFEEFSGSNPAVRGYYGILNLKDNTFPTDGQYWKASQFGSIFVDYDSLIDRKWSKGPAYEGAPYYDQPKSFAISNNIVELETATSRGWQGYTAKTVNMQESSSWEVASTLTVTEDDQVNKCISLYLDYEYVEFAFKQGADGNGIWQYWDPSYDDGEGGWQAISGISTEPGEYDIKITFNEGIIHYSIGHNNSIVSVSSGRYYESKTKIGTIALISYCYGKNYKTTWTYPVVK